MNPEIERIEKAGVTLWRQVYNFNYPKWDELDMFTRMGAETVGKVSQYRALPLPDMTTLLALARKGEEAVKERDEYVEREAACCPEDFGFEEVIATLRKERDAAVARAEEARALLKDASAALQMLTDFNPHDTTSINWRLAHTLWADAKATLTRIDAHLARGAS